MSRFLLVVPPLAGHVNPAQGIADALVADGHEVAWCGSEAVLRPLLGTAATVFPTGSRLLRPQSDHGLAAVKSVWERFIVPFATFTLPAVERAAREFRPDVLVVDQHCPAGALVAHRLGLTWATVVASTMDLGHPLSAMPQVTAWIEERLRGLWAKAGLPAHAYADPRFSPHLVLSCAAGPLAGPGPFPDHFALVGPTVGTRPDQPDFPWEWLGGRAGVLVSMGTLADDITARFLREAIAALAPLGERMRAVVVAPPEALPPLPAHVLARRRVPMLDLLPRMSAVLTHGGLNTVSEALAVGVPLVVAPIRHDQPINAARVVGAGAGVRVNFARSTAPVLRAALTGVLDDPALRAGAAAVRDAFAAAGGARAAARHLAELAAAPGPAAEPTQRAQAHRSRSA
ncbi:glycosyltransferase [Actinokineospora sp. PR83]|uniref:glycosyltransferase n=1 Tax=Actinokineospora sp. PR83 TaxID=2884908 RepID=UPI0027DFACA2|nr:glycosyltransferase [Actinokineospora sp. PR83]MCG8915966.1 glycosyltransferase [Actinokineospora sp. PR83]